MTNKEGSLPFHDELKRKVHESVVLVYRVTEHFPKTEMYGVTSQLRRATVSVMLNYIEGFARFKPKVKINFYEISYGSVKESKYLYYLSKELGWLPQIEYTKLMGLNDEISKMLWSLIQRLQKEVS